ncbi:MAG TPA: hypothetical protein VHM90_19325 [Phycisphaerae bacterium]|jgi:hypothetical protein|nr:hypothetical protein [Phycisphaerae bacterium]
MTQAAKPKAKQKKMPIPAKRQKFKDALAATNKQYAETLARLAK